MTGATKTRLTFQSEGETLVGNLYMPQGGRRYVQSLKTRVSVPSRVSPACTPTTPSPAPSPLSD
jgi:hypothetical protein